MADQRTQEELGKARQRIARLERDLEAVTHTRWWRARELLRDARRQPSALLLLLPRLLRLLLRGSVAATGESTDDRAHPPVTTGAPSPKGPASDPRQRLTEAATGRAQHQARLAPCDAPPTRNATLTAVVPPGAEPPWIGGVVDEVTQIDGARLWLLTAPADADRVRTAHPSAQVLALRDEPALRAEAFRASGVVMVDLGEDRATAEDAGRTALEAAATGCAVVGHDPRGLYTDLGLPDLGPRAQDAATMARQARFLLTNPEMIERIGAVALRRAHASRLTGAAGGATTTPNVPTVSAVLATVRPHRLEQAVRALDAQQGVDVQLVVVGHGFEPDAAALRTALDGGAVGEVHTRQAPTDHSLGEVLNLGFGAADAPLLAKVDDDDLYGPHYLQEQALAAGYAGAEIVGKWSWHLYLSSLDVTVLRRPGHEHRTHPHVSGATMLLTRDAFDANPFPARARGEDIELLRRGVSLGMHIYSTSRFNFIAVRHGGDHGHTWRADDLEVATRGADDRVRFVGPSTDQIFL